MHNGGGKGLSLKTWTLSILGDGINSLSVGCLSLRRSQNALFFKMEKV
jgi:hypothetical protein